ncbi:hypothetical protein CHUAL_013769 [Chamberlinius hualienensis]
MPEEFLHLLWSSTSDSTGHLTNEPQVTLNQEGYFKYFTHQEVRYCWDHRINNYCKLSGYDVNMICSNLFEKFKGFSEDQQKLRLEIFGDNCIQVEVKSYGKLLIEEVLNPFYIFQIFSIILWSNDDYFYFAACILLVSLLSISVSLYKTRKQSEALHQMVSATSSNSVIVLQRNKMREISSVNLVPGDVITIPSNGCIMNCDAVLVSGNCVVNESMLTGESVPVTKTPLLFQDDEIYSPQQHKRHTLFCGTKVIQTKNGEDDRVTAIVIRTGFNTSKGELIREILYPKPIDFKFYRDSVKFIGVLTVMASLGMIYALVLFLLHGADAVFIVKRVLDIVTIVVPPSLPAAMTVGSVYAQNRLKAKDIFCISPNRINVAGKINLFCFDKTGTLTEDGLDMWGVVPSNNGSFQPLERNPSSLHLPSSLLSAMATCHSLSMINGQLIGDPLDLKTFESTQWVQFEMQSYESCFGVHNATVIKPPSPLYLPTVQEVDNKIRHEIAVVRQFPFSSTLQMMSVITHVSGEDHLTLFAKGAPETIISICLSSSVPSNFYEILHEYTVQGFRVIAFALKKLDKRLTWQHSQKIKRSEVENKLTFLGLSVMQNSLKKETAEVIDVLIAANIRTVMVTGDNLQTAINVAKNCGMIHPNEQIIIVNAGSAVGDSLPFVKYEAVDRYVEPNNQMYDSVNENGTKPNFHYAIDGKSFAAIKKYFPDLLLKLTIKGTIFARMTPDQKTQLVEQFQEQDYMVGMCGDGANDCGALKAAHVGISLSETEASVAAPFTSKKQNIECVPEVIKDGKCALVTSFSVFKFMALYSIIQFISVLILYTHYNNLSDTQFLLIDLVIATMVAVSMGYTAAYDKLTTDTPHGTLLGPSILTSIFLQIIFAAIFQVLMILYLKKQTWYVSIVPLLNVKYTPSFESTFVFCISTFQYLSVAITVSKGKPFRKPVYTNVPLLLSVMALAAISISILIWPAGWTEEFFQIIHENDWQDFQFRLSLLLMALLHLIVSFVIEYAVETITFKKVSKVICHRSRIEQRYKTVQSNLEMTFLL